MTLQQLDKWVCTDPRCGRVVDVEQK